MKTDQSRQLNINIGDPELYYFDQKAAERVITFFEKFLCHVKGAKASEPLLLQPWQKEMLSEIFGVKRKKDGLRRYRKAYIEVPRKMGKTTLAAGVALYMLIADGEMGAEVYSCAGDHSQARICLELAQQMVGMNPALSKAVDIQKNKMFFKTKRGIINKYEAVTAKAESRHGTNPSCVVYDELHVAPDRDLYESFNTGMGARKQPLYLIITTSGRDRSSICYELHKYSKDVQAGLLKDDSWYSRTYGLPIGENWEDPENWKVANPNIDVSVTMDSLMDAYNKAKNSPGESLNFRQYRLCQWVDSVDGWLNVSKWQSLQIQHFPQEKSPVYLGLDLAYRDDMTALSLVFPMEGGRYYTDQYFFCPKDNLVNRGKSRQVDYTTWASSGHLTLTEGEVTDFDFVIKKIDEIAEKYRVQEIAIDPSQAAHVINILDKKGYRVIELAPSNVKRLSSSCKEFENMINAGLIHNSGNPIMTWMVGNAVATYDAYDNIRLQKGKASEKIDGVVATIMALDRALMNVKKTLPDGFFKISTL